MGRDKEKNEHKLLLEMLGLMDEMAQKISDLDADVGELEEYVEDLDSDLSDMAGSYTHLVHGIAYRQAQVLPRTGDRRLRAPAVDAVGLALIIAQHLSLIHI